MDLNKEASALFLQLEGTKRQVMAEAEQQQSAILLGAGIVGSTQWTSKNGIVTVITKSARKGK